MTAIASLALSLLLLAQAPAYADDVPLIEPGQWAKTHAPETVPLTWHWRRIQEFDIEVQVDTQPIGPPIAWRDRTLDIRFAAALKLADDMPTMAVAACSISVHGPDDMPLHEFDRAPEVPGAFWRENILSDTLRQSGGSDRGKYAMAYIATLHRITEPGRYLVGVYCRARVSWRAGEDVVPVPSRDSYGYDLDRIDDRHLRGYRPGADGVVLMDSDWYDSYPGQAQNHLTVEVR